ncbi:MAG: rhodopsin [Crocinitomicaceae bacterium]|jgi:bacteriorhodopsin|nr:rhodopsin [Crocinitomicaceae bacterium]MEC9160087.1 bacteriorhodopsin-like [Bacteroidota bacterium]|tara:strand:+ start:25 stop:768 length:744 start_codon:yes stop_codon:yes gene_type:complete
METLNNFLLEVPRMASDDYVGFTFFVGCMAMMAASAFFFLSMSSFDKKWRTSILVSGLITFIAAVHYYYMRGYWADVSESPTFFRYVDWILTVPLMCVEFYLILKAAGATKKHMWTLIVASTAMLVFGYWGEAVDPGRAQIWGAISGAAYFYVVYLIFFGELKNLATSAGGETLRAHNILAKFVLIGWAIYPLGYMIGTADGQWYSFLADAVGQSGRDVVYNVGDAINKIGFGLVVYGWAVAGSKES